MGFKGTRSGSASNPFGQRIDAPEIAKMAKGSIIAGTDVSTDPAVFPAGADGQALVYDSTKAEGMKGANPTPVAHALGGAEHTADTLANLNAKVSDATLDDSGDTRTPTAHALGGSEHTADTLANLNSKVSDANLIDTGDARLSDSRTPTAHNLGGAEHSADTLANLNVKISDANLIDTADSRLSDSRTPTAHNLGGAEHSADTLANLNTKISDANLIDTGDSRLSDSRTPTAHGASHTDGSDDIQNATAAQKGVATATQITKLDGIETSATADQSNAEIETAYNAQVSVVSQAEAEAGIATTVRRWTAERVKQAIAALGGGGLGYIIDWGGNAAGGDTGKFMRADGAPAGAMVTGINPESERTVPKAATLNRLAWNTETADGTTIMKIHKDSVVVETLTLTGATGSIALTNAVALDVGLALEFDTGTGPGKSTWIIYAQ